MDHRELDEDLGSLRHAMHEDGDGELYGWMRVRYASFCALLAESRRPDWKRLAAGLARLGVLDGRGKPPRAETARQTWWKVRRDVAALSNHPSSVNSDADTSLRVNPQLSETAPQVPPADLPVSPAGGFDPNDITADDTTEPEFRPATPRYWPPAPQPRDAIAGAATNPDHGQDYKKVLLRLTERARARSLPMPDVPTAEDE